MVLRNKIYNWLEHQNKNATPTDSYQQHRLVQLPLLQHRSIFLKRELFCRTLDEQSILQRQK
jgi:hypothetical protein